MRKQVETRNFQQELAVAGPKAERIADLLAAMGIEHEPIDWQRAGRLAWVKVDGVEIGDLISLHDHANELLEEVRHVRCKQIAEDALGLAHGGHLVYITPLIALINANWSVEISFDGKDTQYALVNEFLEPAGNSAGYRRVYKLYAAKANSICDVPECNATYNERKVVEMSDGTHCVHVCSRHSDEDPERLYLRLWKAQPCHAPV